MDKKLNLTTRLNFSEIDLTAPDKVVAEIFEQLPEETNGIILGAVKLYDGHIFSYTKRGLSSISIALGATEDKEIDIQDSLGKFGEETCKFECYLYTPEYPKYKYRMFFMRYDIANYPVKLVLEESIANSISGNSSGYIYSCKSRAELEELVTKILTSKRAIDIMQELIRINQAKKDANKGSDAEEL